MYTFVRSSACLIVAVLCLWQFSAQANTSSASLCAEDETLVFTCSVADQKLVSVCASGKYGADEGYMQYRYGSVGKVEVAVPAEKVVPSKAAQSGMWMFSGGGGAYVRFVDNETAYYVYSAIGRWGEDGETEERDGAAVEKDGKIIEDIRCAKSVNSILGPEFFEEVGLPEVEVEFNLP